MARFSSVAMQTTGAGSNASSPSVPPHLVVSPNSSDDEDDQHHIHRGEGIDQDTALLLPPIVAPAGGEGNKDQPFVISPRRRAVASKMMMSASINDDLSEKASDSFELLDGAEKCSSKAEQHHHERRPDCYRLCTYDEAPPYLQHNPFIRTGYRVNFSFPLCVESLYRLHNESWNVWTHGFGFALFLLLAAVTMQELTWDTPLEPFVFLGFFITVECSMLSSTIFHAFNCHSPSTYKWTCRFDYSSISLLLIGAYAPMLYYGFMCEPFWQTIYLSGLFLLGSAGVLISFIPIFSTPQYTSFRTGVFVALGWSTILPLPHMLYIHGLALVWAVARWELLVGVIYTTGAVLYAKRIPERWSPGQYDTSFMCSHSLWHCFTIAGALTQLYACVQVYHIFRSNVMGNCHLPN